MKELNADLSEDAVWYRDLLEDAYSCSIGGSSVAGVVGHEVQFTKRLTIVAGIQILN